MSDTAVVTVDDTNPAFHADHGWHALAADTNTSRILTVGETVVVCDEETGRTWDAVVDAVAPVDLAPGQWRYTLHRR